MGTQDDRRMISASFVEEALDSLRQRDLPTQAALAAAGLREGAAEPVSPQVYGRLWLALAATLGDELFGVGARPLPPGGFTLMCHCVVHARTIETALRRALRFLNLALEEPRGELVVEGGLARIVLRESGPPRSAFAYRTYWIALHGAMSWLARRRLPLRAVEFRGPEPEHCADYRLLFGAPARFGGSRTTLAFDRSFLALPVARDEAALKAFLRGAPANILVRYAHDAGLVAAVRTRLREAPPQRWPSADGMAKALGLPSSTLRHRLHWEGQSYRAIRDDVLRGLAVRALAEPNSRVAEVATRLGFAEPSAFHRAFVKWFGATPAAYRREVLRADKKAPAPGRRGR
mgnify:CR=1 FL=1|jgi:AraC-like DNA-binding protein